MADDPDHRLNHRPADRRDINVRLPRCSARSIRPGKQTPETIGRRLLEIVVYDKRCRIGGTLTLDDLAETSEVGDWKMSQFNAALYSISPSLRVAAADQYAEVNREYGL
jgi:hypothetical protein